MASNVEICNLALQKLGAKAIVSLTEDSKNARECNRAFDVVRRREIRKRRWNFAMSRVTLAPDSASPEFDYDYQFTLPANCLKVIKGINDTDWIVEGRKILTNLTNTLYLRYLKDVTDPNVFDSTFIEVLASALAVQLNGRVTQDKNLKLDLKEDYKTALREAVSANSFEPVPDEQPYDTWVTARV